MRVGDKINAVASPFYIGNYVIKREYARKPFRIYEWDFQENSKLEPLYRNHFYPVVKAIIYVIDSAALDIMEEDAIGFQKLVRCESLNRDVVILVIANKQDLTAALSVEEISERYGLETLKQSWHIIGASALNGVEESLRYLANKLDVWKQ
mmetsp:Transcript_26083/g.29022  ORF Transcript_26083/g.29022 Transcript_26083/m.29022 type:complete len:151 (-) Transcript_26083:54-506(-)